MVFGLFKKKHPVITADMIQSDGALTPAICKKLVKDTLIQLDYDKQDAVLTAEEFADHLKYDIQELKDNIKSTKDGIKDSQKELKSLQAKLKKTKDEDEADDLQSLIEDSEEEIKEETEEMAEAEAELAKLNDDKDDGLRNYFLNFINTELHGEN
jgi:septal ring factor EnvC (AmiA/AmiB activator)